ncbi:phage tail tape measure protein [Streptomyces sp. NPDC094153]|uniref:phage tail tape measure protein n=1 Tax=Streptomyces sp. NPDC094153 TaxID=3366058 RepID=UPI003830B385
MTQLRGTLAQARTQVDGTAKGFKQAGATAFAGMATMGRSVSMIGAGVAVASVKMAGDFEAQTMVLRTAAGETEGGLKTVRKGILDIAKGTGTSWHNLTEGMYQIEKAGIRGADGLKVLKAAAQGAREENASLESVTNAMTSVMASYHLKAKDSVQVMNAMKTAAGEGKMTMEQFASSLSSVLPIASANKISFAEVSGALATLTQHGTTARHGTDELNATIRALASPNNVAVQEMQRLGLSSTEVAKGLKDVDQGGRGLTGTLDLLSRTVLSKMGKDGTVLLSSFNKTKQAAHDADVMIQAMPKSIQGLAKSYNSGKISLDGWRKTLKGLPPEQANLLQQYATLQNKTNGFSAELKRGGPAAQTYTEAMKKMLNGSIGLNTSLQLTGENTESYNHRVDEIRKSYQHATKDVEGWDLTQNLFNVRLAKAKQTIQVLGIEIGTKLLPVIITAVDWFGRHKDVAVALAAVIGGVLALSVVAFAAKTTMTLLKPIGTFAKLGVSATKAGARVVQGFRSAQVAGSAFSGKAGSFGGTLRKMWDGTISGAKTAARAAGKAGKALASAAARGGRAAWSGLATAVRGAGAAMRTAGTAALGLAKKTAMATAAALRAAVAWALQKVRMIAAAVAEGVLTAAQWLLNVAMNANPLGLIILGIAALVAGIVLAYNKIGWFRDFCDGAFKVIGAAIGWVVDFVKAHWPLLLALLTGPIGIAVLLIVKYWDKIKSGFLAAYHGTIDVGKDLLKWVEGLPGQVRDYMVQLTVHLILVAHNAWQSFKDASVKKAVELTLYVKGLPQKIKDKLGNLGALLIESGKSLMRGFIDGIKAMFGPAVSEAKHVLSGIRDFFPHSPAKKGPFSGSGWTLYSGRALMDGLSQGIRDGAPAATATMQGAAQATANSFARTLGIASPSKVFRSLGIYVVQGLVDGMTGSTASVKAATRRIESLFMQTRNRLMDQRKALKAPAGKGKAAARKAAANNAAARKTNAWVAAKLKALARVEDYVKREDKVMRSLAAKRDAVAGKLKDAQKKLKDLQKAWSDEVKNVASGIMQGFSIVTEAPQIGFALTAQDVVNKMRDQMAQAVQFAAQLQTLKKKGLSADLIAQIAAAGVEQGGATAAALSGASKGQIAEINKLQKTTVSAADTAGKAVADSMYGSGIKAAQGLVKGLQSQEKAIEKQMLKIAKAMQKAIKQALGIKSPSRVFMGIGQWIPRGLAAGVEGAAHHATRAVDRLATSVTGAGSFVGSGLAMAGAGGGGAVVVHNHFEFHVEGSVTTVDKLAKDVESAFLRRGMRNPLTYQQYKR